MRILLLIDSLKQGGAETCLIAIANAFAEREHAVQVVAADGPLRKQLHEKVGFAALPPYSAIRAPSLIREIGNAIGQFAPDVVHSHGGKYTLLARVAMRRRSKAALVFTHHARRLGPAERLMPRIMANRVDAIIALTQGKVDQFRAIGFPSEKLVHIPNFVPRPPRKGQARQALRNELGIPDDAFIILWIGRMVWEKQPNTFVRVVAHVQQATPREIWGVMVGAGPQLARVQSLTAGQRFKVLGFQDDVLKFFLGSDVLFFPTQHPEVLPMVLVEAAAAELPIVCSDVEGNLAVVTPGKTGLAVAPVDADYVRALSQLVRDRSLGRLLAGAAYRDFLARFEKETVVQRLSDLYRQLSLRRR